MTGLAKALLFLVLGAMTGTALAFSPSPAEVGLRAAGVFLDAPDFMMYEVGDVTAVHYAEVASALGAARLAEATGDRTLLDRVAVRHNRLIEADLPNTANHVDANVYGLWPLVLGGVENRDRGLLMADGQWAETTGDGLTAQARYWIDDVWMIGALQVQAWRTTREPRYLDRAALMARLYIARLQQPNGLFHHGPDAPFFWGRGNGWVAAGLAEILSELPAEHPEFAAIVTGYRRMMAGLLRFQAEDGMWLQLIDHRDSWKETSSTAMFGYAMAVGVRRGLLADPEYAEAYRRAWTALSAYVGSDGRLSQICAGTGQSADASYYLGRPVLTGDLHGQAALLWFAAELTGAPELRR
jgi:rhamnogalacturonyl hydrolase YesR